MPNRINKPLSNIKTQIDAFIKRIVSKAIYKAINIIVSPCCELSATTATFTCTSTGIATVKLKLNIVEVFPITVTANLLRNGVIVATNGTYDNNGTLTFTGVAVTNVSATWGASIFLPTSTVGDIGVFQNIATVTAIPSTCP